MKSLRATITLIYALLLATGCSQISSAIGAKLADEVVPELKAEILISDISNEKCLNLEKLMVQLDNPQFSFPAATMNTDFKTITGISASKANYFAYSTFYYKPSKANELALFNQPKQTDCESIELRSASGAPLTYKIVESSDLHIRFQLVDTVRENISKTHKTAYMERIQPFEYTVIYASKNNLKIIEKYKSVDPLCVSKNTIKLEVTKNITWAQNESELPSRYEITPEYFKDVKNSVQADGTTVIPELDSANTISVAEIQSIMNLPVRSDLKYCHN